MDLQQRIVLLERLGNYLLSDDPQWEDIKHTASIQNQWFLPEFISKQLYGIATRYLDRRALEQFVSEYEVPVENPAQKTIGIIMAGNIPLVGFHDFLCCFIWGHRLRIKVSAKDNILFPHLVNVLCSWESTLATEILIEQNLKGCDAYIATGSNNSSRYFEYYFAKYPHIIRRNRTSVAILDGNETVEQLEALADDVYTYFGLGCRNVTKIYVPREYDFLPLLESFKKYNYLFDHNRYKNNYDYQLAILIINSVYYMTNGSLLLREDKSLFSPIGELNYEFYDDVSDVYNYLEENSSIQCVVGKGHIPFGEAQAPALTDFADGVDVMQFLKNIN
ncbi:MAG TPA: hypothetical protein VLC28_02575 [Flavitalea sp.]|nr:hypothetical protein [Flavitalea sp.]